MNKQTFIFLLLISFMFLAAPLINAEEPERFTVWTDKPEYAPGESGKLYIVFYNNYGFSIEIEQVTVIFDEWRAYLDGKWEGNWTKIEKSAVAPEDVFKLSVEFTVPEDGRAKTTNVQILIETTEVGNISWPEYPEGFYISVVQAPKYLEQIITLFTIQVVLIIVCTIIIAATIFLSSRKPQVIKEIEQKTEEKEEQSP